MLSVNKFFNGIFYLLLVFILSSCASNLVVNSRGCNEKANFFSLSKDENSYKTLTYNQFGFGEVETSLKDIFSANKEDCSAIRDVNIILESDFFDGLLGIIPGFSSQKIKVIYR